MASSFSIFFLTVRRNVPVLLRRVLEVSAILFFYIFLDINPFYMNLYPENGAFRLGRVLVGCNVFHMLFDCWRFCLWTQANTRPEATLI